MAVIFLLKQQNYVKYAEALKIKIKKKNARRAQRQYSVRRPSAYWAGPARVVQAPAAKRPRFSTTSPREGHVDRLKYLSCPTPLNSSLTYGRGAGMVALWGPVPAIVHAERPVRCRLVGLDLDRPTRIRPGRHLKRKSVQTFNSSNIN